MPKGWLVRQERSPLEQPEPVWVPALSLRLCFGGLRLRAGPSLLETGAAHSGEETSLGLVAIVTPCVGSQQILAPGSPELIAAHFGSPARTAAADRPRKGRSVSPSQALVSEEPVLGSSQWRDTCRRWPASDAPV